MPKLLERLNQRDLALELRYAIDVARKQPSVVTLARVRELVVDHPVGVDGSHVQHNLGASRQTWLDAFRSQEKI